MKKGKKEEKKGIKKKEIDIDLLYETEKDDKNIEESQGEKNYNEAIDFIVRSRDNSLPQYERCKEGNITHNSPLYILYEKTKDILRPESEIIRESDDLYPEFLEDLFYRIKYKRLITITLRGEPASGKSVVGLKIQKTINYFIEKLITQKKVDCWGCICSDQVEWNRIATKGEMNRCYLVDEWSELSTTGRNASSEMSLFQFYLDICAQRYLHRILCTPRAGSIYDDSSNFIIDIRGRNEKTKETYCYIYYKDSASSNAPFLLGVMYIPIGDIIADPDYELKYRKKKFARISLLDEEGIRDIRELEQSRVILKIYNELLPLVNEDSKISRDLIPICAQNTLNEEKLLYSIVGEYDLERPIYALLTTAHLIKSLARRLKKPSFIGNREKKEEEIRIAQDKLDTILRNYKRKEEVLEKYLAIK